LCAISPGPDEGIFCRVIVLQGEYFLPACTSSDMKEIARF
jgi:hypothetical protein